MDEDRNLSEVLSSLDALDKRLRAIEEYRKNAPDSDEALRDMRGELERIRAALDVPAAAAQQPDTREAKQSYRILPPVYRGGSPRLPHLRRSTPADPQKVQRPKLSERNLGKYLLGVLAAVLILLAAGVLIAAVWPVIPDSLKFLALLACGVGLQLAGMRFVLKSENRRNGFWLSVTGLGAGVSLMAVAAGCLAWGLYPLSLAGALAAVWFGCNLVSAQNLDSPVFYVIAYIGAAFSVMLSVGLASSGDQSGAAPFRLTDQIPVAVMPILILVLGDFAAFRHPRRCLRVLNYLASLFFIYMLGVFAAELTLHVNEARWGASVLFFGPAPGLVVAPAILLIFMHLIHISPDALERRREKPGLDWIRVLAVFTAGFTGIFAVYRGLDSVAAYATRYIDADLTVAAVGVVVGLTALAVMVIRREQIDYLLLGLTVPLVIVFASVSDSLLDLPCLFPVLFCVLLVMLNRRLRRGSVKLSLWLALGLTGIMVISQSGRRMGSYFYGADLQEAWCILLFTAACFIYLAILCLTYAGELKPQSKWRHLTSLACAVLIGLTAAKGAYTVTARFLPEAGPEAVYPEIIASALLFHRWYVQAKARSEYGLADLAWLLWSVCAGIFTVYLHVGIAFSPRLERGVCVMVLMAMAGSSVAWASASGSTVYAVLSVLFANETLAFAGGVNDIYGLTLSVLGVCLCAGFIWLGFFREIRAMRRLGLAGMILYVLKIALLDVQSARGSAASTALSLLFAGLVCFCVSFVYNRLDRRYGGGERESQEDT